MRERWGLYWRLPMPAATDAESSHVHPRTYPQPAMASDCAVDTARSAAICSPSSGTPRLPPTTTAVNANCGPPRPTARSPAASAPNGARTCSPPSAPSSAPHSDAEWTPIRRSKPPYTAAQRSNRVEQIHPMTGEEDKAERLKAYFDQASRHKGGTVSPISVSKRLASMVDVTLTAADRVLKLARYQPNNQAAQRHVASYTVQVVG